MLPRFHREANQPYYEFNRQAESTTRTSSDTSNASDANLSQTAERQYSAQNALSRLAELESANESEPVLDTLFTEPTYAFNTLMVELASSDGLQS